MKLKVFICCTALLSPVALGDEAKQALAGELLDCAAYYQIASEAISAMNTPQMASVSSRLGQQSQQAQALAGQYMSAQELPQAFEQARQNKIMTMKDSNDLRGLMATYKDKCKAILADPDARLEYWMMATM